MVVFHRLVNLDLLFVSPQGLYVVVHEGRTLFCSWLQHFRQWLPPRVGLSENSVPPHPMVLLIIIPTKWLFHWGYTPFSDIPSLPADLQFKAKAMFVTNGGVIYVFDELQSRILRINPAEPFELVVVGQIPTEPKACVSDLFVTEGGTIYVAEQYQRKVLTIHPGNTLWYFFHVAMENHHF